MTMATMGLKWGIKAKAPRDTAANAANTPTVTSSRAWGFRVSKVKKNGIIASTTIRVAVR
jgi:hypothetical protein